VEPDAVSTNDSKAKDEPLDLETKSNGNTKRNPL
jgi:hypothetical protein